MRWARSRPQGVGGAVVARRDHGDGDACMVLQLDPLPDAARVARSWIVESLGDWPDEGVEAARLLVTEVVTNAVLHARTPIELCVRAVGDWRRFEVADGHPSGPLHKHFQTDAATGRGLLLLDSMADEWGVVRTDAGKVIWFTLGPDSGVAAKSQRAPAGPGDRGMLGRDRDGAPSLRASEPATPEAGAPGAASRAPGEPPEAGVPGVKVVIEGVPVAVYLEAAQHSDALLREFAFLAQASPGEPSAGSTPRRLLELVDEVAAVFNAARTNIPLEIEPALERGSPTVDFEVVVPEDGWQLLLVLASYLDEIDRYCEQGNLVTLTSSPTVRRFRRWYSQQVADQVAGKPPEAWPAGD